MFSRCSTVGGFPEFEEAPKDLHADGETRGRLAHGEGQRRISSTLRATVISLAQLGVRASACLLDPVVGYGIDAGGLPFVLSALGVLFSIVFIVLLLALVLRDRLAMPRPVLGLRAGG